MHGEPLHKCKAVGNVCASQLFVTAGDNPQRLNLESGFAALCGVSPVPVSFGKQTVTGLTVAVIVRPIVPCTLLPMADYVRKREHKSMRLNS